MRHKKIIVITMCCLFTVGAVACGNGEQETTDQVTTQSTMEAEEEQAITEEQTSTEEFVPIEVDERYEYKLRGSSLEGISEDAIIGVNTPNGWEWWENNSNGGRVDAESGEWIENHTQFNNANGENLFVNCDEMSNFFYLQEPDDTVKATEWKKEEGEQDTPFGTAKLYYSKYDWYHTGEVEDSLKELYKEWGYVTDESGTYLPTEQEMAVIDIGEYQAVIRYQRTNGPGEYQGKIEEILQELFTLK